MSDGPTRNVAIYIFDEIEVLDFCGPFEVFTVAGRKGAFNVYTVAEQEHTISTRGGMQVIPRYTWENAPAPHIIVVPGGKGAEQLVDHAPTVNWVRATAASAELVLIDFFHYQAEGQGLPLDTPPTPPPTGGGK